MSSLNLVSIIVPVYNAEKSIEKTITTILNQSYRNIELILINDGSNDNSGAICDKFAEKDKKAKVIHTENKGVSNARNEGLKKAEGEFISFVDADDMIADDMISTFVNIICEQKVDMVIAQIERHFKKLDTYVKSAMSYTGHYETKEFREKIISDYFGSNANKFITGCSGKLFKNSIIKNNEITFDSNLEYGEDTLFVFQYIMNAKGFCVISDYYPYKYLIHDESVSNKFEDKRFRRKKYMVGEYKNILGSSFKPEYNRTYFYIGLDAFYNLSGLQFLKNISYIKAELKVALNDRELIESFRYINFDKLSDKEKLLYWLFKRKSIRMLLLLLFINKIKKSFCNFLYLGLNRGSWKRRIRGIFDARNHVI